MIQTLLQCLHDPSLLMQQDCRQEFAEVPPITFTKLPSIHLPGLLWSALQEWMSARPDVFQAKEAIHQNPAGALAPVPLMGLPLLLESFGRQNSQEVNALILVMRHGCQCTVHTLCRE